MLVKIFLGHRKIKIKKNFGPQKFWVQQNFRLKKLLGLKKFGSKSFVKIGSVTAEIFLIWTIFTRKVLV